MIFYHGTTKEQWAKIQEEGVLFGRDRLMPSRRLTYLAADQKEAKCYGDVVLQVEYNPFEHPNMNNYYEDCWQFRVYEPIPIHNVKEIKQKEDKL